MTTKSTRIMRSCKNTRENISIKAILTVQTHSELNEIISRGSQKESYSPNNLQTLKVWHINRWSKIALKCNWNHQILRYLLMFPLKPVEQHQVWSIVVTETILNKMLIRIVLRIKRRLLNRKISSSKDLREVLIRYKIKN